MSGVCEERGPWERLHLGKNSERRAGAAPARGILPCQQRPPYQCEQLANSAATSVPMSAL